MVMSEEMKNLVTQVRMGFVATASKSGVPNVSPKGSLIVVDGSTLAFACVMSEHTIDNLKENQNIAVAVADTQARKGFQFKGKAILEYKGSLFDQLSERMAGMKLPPIKCVARITVTEIFPIPSKG